ncbi:hypothetical protein [Ruminococcus sp.]|uniref:hypothetical protein n=1 Tax=Ruminococcus sp. TaxID=41978 RepID=UPI003890F135
MMVWPIFLAILGAYSIFTGVKTLLTGKLTVREEQRLTDFSQKGARIYKKVYAIISMLGGLLVIGLAVVKLLEAQGVIEQTMIYNIIALGIVAVMVVAMLVARAQCKKMSDDE